jgi:Cof subfamily protein (haloacid dehalogenase superfamily)
MIKAVFFDIDGTLLSFATHNVPLSAIDAINKLRDKDIKVFIATGRSLAQIPKFEDIKFDGFITLNGTYCVTDRNKVVVNNPIPKEDLKNLLRFQNEKKQFPCSFMTNKGTTVNYVDEKVEALAKLVNLPIPKIKNLSRIIKKNVYQINVYEDDMFKHELMSNIFVNCEASRWNNLFFDVNPLGCSKQTGIDAFIDFYKIQLDETMAFGDGGNDIPMLKHVAIGVAMGNAEEKVKQSADYVTDDVDNHGIKNALIKFGII